MAQTETVSRPEAGVQVAKAALQDRTDRRYGLEVYIRYHRYRESFYSTAEGWIKALSIITSSAAIIAIAQPAAPYLLALVAALQAFSIAFRFDAKAREHASLCERYSILLAEIQRLGDEGFTKADVDRWTSEATMIASKEPLVFPVVAVIAQNDYERSSREQPDLIELTLLERIFGVFLRIAPKEPTW